MIDGKTGTSNHESPPPFITFVLQRTKDWRYILEDSGAKCLFVSTKEIYRETYHYAGVQGNVESVFCFEEPEGRPGSFASLLEGNAGEGNTVRTFVFFHVFEKKRDVSADTS